jgi:ParB family chromosome partitioning protein
MAKLDARAAGWNAGANYMVKNVRTADIVIDPEISRIFVKKEKLIAEIAANMKKNGYDKSQPLVITREGHILVDGHTRLAAAQQAGLDEVPAVETGFTNMEDAVLYCFERQVLRRNLTDKEILQAAGMLKGRKNKDGTGRAAEQLAERLGVSAGFVYEARKVLREAPEEDIQAIRDGEKTINEVYSKVKKHKAPAAEPPAVDALEPEFAAAEPVSSPGPDAKKSPREAAEYADGEIRLAGDVAGILSESIKPYEAETPYLRMHLETVREHLENARAGLQDLLKP